jgi:alpha-methylacyl-CoA racemase
VRSEESTGERPLQGVRIVELAGIGPAQLGTMMLADLGAEVVRIDRAGDAPPEAPSGPSLEAMGRGRRSVALDLKQPEAVAWARQLVDAADICIDPYRPGVAARLGLDPEECLQRNPRLIYVQMTGWGQTGALAMTAAHDINYIGIAGVLHPMGSPAEPPPVPLNLTADFGGGAMYMVAVTMAAMVERERTGRGRILDVAMLDGVATMLTSILQFRAQGMWSDKRGSNFLDGAAPFYRAYRTADDRFVTVGAIEDQFYAELLRRLGLDLAEWPQWEHARWPALSERLEALFAAEPLSHWIDLLEGSDACFAPALTFDELPDHPHLRDRGTYVQNNGFLQPAPAPAFGEDVEIGSSPWPGEQSAEILAELGVGEEQIEAAIAAGTASVPGRSPGSGPRNLSPPAPGAKPVSG